ncbi:hypothetical protein C8F04DRAFT_1294793 [Mycena alexandri]|uniref:Uncharacterized protein n=1 Tax=Mycena alexandri TaxID=1745969 RepID=A0AAD6SHA2_9AGAR|nr:hypothetical protein C8F04DRAFT_1294793 [Mycena alexandri]
MSATGGLRACGDCGRHRTSWEEGGWSACSTSRSTFPATDPVLASSIARTPSCTQPPPHAHTPPTQTRAHPPLPAPARAPAALHPDARVHIDERSRLLPLLRFLLRFPVCPFPPRLIERSRLQGLRARVCWREMPVVGRVGAGSAGGDKDGPNPAMGDDVEDEDEATAFCAGAEYARHVPRLPRLLTCPHHLTDAQIAVKAGVYGYSTAPPTSASAVTFAPKVTPISYSAPSPYGPPSLTTDLPLPLFPPSATPAPPPTRRRLPPSKRRSQGYVSRPPNVFMLFRADQKHVPGSCLCLQSGAAAAPARAEDDQRKRPAGKKGEELASAVRDLDWRRQAELAHSTPSPVPASYHQNSK